MIWVLPEEEEGGAKSGGLHSYVSDAFSFFQGSDTSLKLLFSWTSVRVGEEVCMVFRSFEESGRDM